jgi:hypothetical protein
VLSCGHLVALLQAATLIWQSMGFSPREAMDALYPLARASLENVAKGGTANSVTGPVVRGDADTVRSHLEALAHRLPELVPLYRALTEASLPLAAGRGVNPAQLEAIRGLIAQYLPNDNHPTVGPQHVVPLLQGGVSLSTTKLSTGDHNDAEGNGP